MKRLLFILALFPLLLAFSQPSLAATNGGVQQGENGMQQDLGAMRDFNNLHQDETGLLKVSTKERHEILFYMGLGLIIGLLVTAGFGLTMVLGGRPLFIWHMLFAGISITLAIAHAVTAMIWFYPF
jgi:hypothetical protein